MRVLPAFEELALLCDAKGWRLELARVGSTFELRVLNVKGDEIAAAPASHPSHLGQAAMKVRHRLEQRV